MRKLMLVAFAGVAGCASTPTASKPVPPAVFCMPCNVPCTPDESCARFAAPAPTPPPPPVAAPAPAPAPPPPEPAAAASFSPAAGTYKGAQSVTLSTATPRAVIRYTTDGSDPDGSAPVYFGPFQVAKSATVKAIVTASGVPDSAVSSATYAIEPPPRVKVAAEKKKLELTEKVFFDTGKSTIQAVSFPLLDDVAAALKEHPEVKKILIEGHTDSRGSKALNTRLSKARAEAVRRYIVDKGIDASRLAAEGFGPSRPIGDNATADGREENRRVEFTIE